MRPILCDLFRDRVDVAVHLQPLLPAFVEQLDRLPLAVVLAAAQARRFGVEVVLEDWRHSPAARQGGGVLAETLERSWGLLGPSQQQALARLAVFAGGIPEDGLAEVLGEGGAGLIEDLVERSLVQERPGHAHRRWDLLVSVHGFAAGKAGLLPEAAGAADAHAGWALRLARELEVGCLGKASADAVSRFGLERQNLDAAVDRLVATDPVEAVRLLVAMYPLVAVAGPVDAWLARLAPLLPRSDLAGTDLVRAEAAVGRAAADQGRTAEALRRLGAARTLAEEIGEQRLALRCRQLQIGVLQIEFRYDEAAEQARSALELAVDLRDRLAETALLGLLGTSLRRSGRYAEAREPLMRGLSAARRIGRPDGEAACLRQLASLREQAGDLDGALKLREEELAASRAARNRRLEALALMSQAYLRYRLEQLAEAASCVDEAVRLLRRVGAPLLIAEGLVCQARIHETAHRLDEAETALARLEGLGLSSLLFDSYRHHLLGQIALGRGVPARALERLDSALGVLAERGLSVYRGRIHLDRGAALHLLGRPADASAAYEAALLDLRAVADRLGIADGLLRRSVLAVERGQVEGVSADMEEAEGILDLEPVPRRHRDWGRVARFVGLAAARPTDIGPTAFSHERLPAALIEHAAARPGR
jgi:tetratricopeptide (TPR) repeat protein